MSWGNAEWDADCDSKLVENLFSCNVSSKKKKRKKHKNKLSDDSVLGAATSVGRFVRIHPATDYSDTSVKTKVIHNNKRKLLSKDYTAPKKIKLHPINSESDNTATNNGNAKVNGKDQSKSPKTRKRKRKKNILHGTSEKSKSYPIQKKNHNQISNEKNILPRNDFRKSEENHKISVGSNFHDDMSDTKKHAPKPKNIKEENSQPATVNNGNAKVDGKDLSKSPKTRKRKRKKNILHGTSEESKSYPIQKKNHNQITNEKNILPSNDFRKSEENHKISVDSNFHDDMSNTKKNAPKPKNIKEENSQPVTVTIKPKSPYKIKQLKQYLKKHVSSPTNISLSQTPSNSLREKMMKRLQASQFRYINEQLYNSKSYESKEFFQNNFSTFEAYHEGYRQQVSKWPLNPLSVIINTIKKKPAKTVIADFGCGEANLAKSLPDHTVYSFDFVATSDVVTPCDMSNTPLENECVDIVVFCLSLMGSNLSSYILEANRVLKNGGTMMIAEVESRFENVDIFIQDIKKLGFANTFKDLSHKIFYFLYFKKVSAVKKSNKLPSIFLKPCLYKKR